MNVSLESLAVNLAPGQEKDCLKMRLTQKKPEVLREEETFVHPFFNY